MKWTHYYFFGIKILNLTLLRKSKINLKGVNGKINKDYHKLENNFKLTDLNFNF